MKKIFINRTVLLTAIALTFCLSSTYAQAQELDIINPDMSFEFAVVMRGQSTGSISSTASTPFDLTNVGILSIGNQTLTASLNMTSEQTGVWWIALMGIGKIASADFAFGVAPLPGNTARIAIDPNIGLAVATGGVFSVTPVSAEEPITYSINVNGG